MTTPRPVCLFCRTVCTSSSGGDLFPQFLTYLATINIDVEENLEKEDANSCRENFHCCEKCGSLLATIAHHVQKLGQDLLTLYRVTLQNINHGSDQDDDHILEIWRRQSVSQEFNTSISLGDDFHDESFMRDEFLHSKKEKTEEEAHLKSEVEIKTEIDDQEICQDVGRITQNQEYPEDNHSPLQDDIPPEEDESYLDDILELAEEADDVQIPSKQRKKASSSHKRRNNSTKKWENSKIMKLADNRTIPGKQTEFDPNLSNLPGGTHIDLRTEIDSPTRHFPVNLEPDKFPPTISGGDDEIIIIDAQPQIFSSSSLQKYATKYPDILYPDVEVKVELDNFVLDDDDDLISAPGKDPLDLSGEDRLKSPSFRTNCSPLHKSRKAETKNTELRNGCHDDDAERLTGFVEVGEEFVVKVDPALDDDEINNEVTPGSGSEHESAALPGSKSGPNLLKLRVVCKTCGTTFSRHEHLVRHLKNKNVHKKIPRQAKQGAKRPHNKDRVRRLFPPSS